MTSYEIETARTPEAVLLETINHHLSLWFCAHRECQDEIREYKVAQSYLETIAGDDEQAATHLLITLAKDTYRLVYGHSWDVRR